MTKLCELCRQAPQNDMRFGINLCKECLSTFSLAMTGNTEAALRLADSRNFPDATPSAQRSIIDYYAKRVGQLEQQQEAQKAQAEEEAQAEQHEQERKQYARSIGVDYRAVEEEDDDDSGLYSDIGSKIKGWAKAIFAVETIFAVISAIGMMFLGGFGVFLGFMFLVIGPLAAWVSSWLLYAFGELVDKTCANERHNRAILKIMLQERKK